MCEHLFLLYSVLIFSITFLNLDILFQDWVTETSDYLCVYVLNLPYIDRQTCLAPDCLPGRSSYLCVYVLNLPYIDRQNCPAPEYLPGRSSFLCVYLSSGCSKINHQTHLAVVCQLGVCPTQLLVHPRMNANGFLLPYDLFS
jgi:hypothetical protein